jgi:NDP-sugar pyrophosphorylase family protein
LINGDTLTDCAIADVIRTHETSNAYVTMAVVAGDVARYGGVLVDDGGVVRGFGRATPGTRALHFIGVQAVESSVFATLPDDEPHETVRSLYPGLIAADDHAIAAFESNAEFLDVGTPRDYHRTVLAVAAREAQPIDVGADCTIAPDAEADSTILWDRVTIGARAKLIDCIVADDVVVPAGSRYAQATLVNTRLGLEARPF